MAKLRFEDAFKILTGDKPFPWQQRLYEHWFAKGKFPSACNIPTGLGKTSVVAVWLIALANHRDKLPRRLVHVVNRRTVVDQTTTEVERLRANLRAGDLSKNLRQLCAIPFHDDEPPLAISTLRGQFEDNREWSADPARPAVIVGTVDMIGSRLLFGGYGVGFRAKPLHAAFLGQDVLLVHDEAHLEPAFQHLLAEIQKEQERCKEFRAFRVMELSATSRGSGDVLELDDQDRADFVIQRRIGAKKSIHLIESGHERKLAEEIADLALKYENSKQTVLVFARKVEDVEKIVKRLPKGSSEQLTGTLRGKERDELVEKPIFRRFLPNAQPGDQTVYLVCTSAGEVGVNISADHLVCDLSTFDSMVQRFGRVNRFGDCADSEINIVYPKRFDQKNEFESRRRKSSDLLMQLNGDGSPNALGKLDAISMVEAFAPTPTHLPVSDILFDFWALTTIREKLPGRPPIDAYLHGLSNELPETHVAWRDEVGIITGELLTRYDPEGLLEDFPLKPHELLRDSSSRVFDRLKKLKAPSRTSPAWVVSQDGSVTVTILGQLLETGKDGLSFKTVLLPPAAGGLENGMLTSMADTASDVSDEWYEDEERTVKRRLRVWDDDPQLHEKTKGMRLIRPPIDMNPDLDEEDGRELAGRRFWYWYELPKTGDSDGSESSKKAVLWQIHTDDVEKNVTDIVRALPLPEETRQAVILAAKFHDLGKRRTLFQKILGNLDPQILLAKAGTWNGRVPEQYRHEFGSLLDVLDQHEFKALQDRPECQELILHMIASHHGYGRPHFPADKAFDQDYPNAMWQKVADEVPQRFARLQRRYGRWGLAYLESLLRAADYAASANPSAFVKEK
jgi:CRISPR-associated endonuclease/helicase Cas3